MGIRILPYVQELSDNGVYVITADNSEICNAFDSLLGAVYIPIRLVGGAWHSQVPWRLTTTPTAGKATNMGVRGIVSPPRRGINLGRNPSSFEGTVQRMLPGLKHDEVSNSS